MPIVFGEMVTSVEEITASLARHGDGVRGMYRAHYHFAPGSLDLYRGVRLERPESLRDNPSDVLYPWEQIFTAAAACAGSDYVVLAQHFGVPLESVDLVVEGEFDPRGEFEGLAALHPAARDCYPALHLQATMVSSAPRAQLERIHRRVLSHNMVLNALRGVPRTDELVVLAPAYEAVV